jgi:hypothetical protein
MMLLLRVREIRPLPNAFHRGLHLHHASRCTLELDMRYGNSDFTYAVVFPCALQYLFPTV